jgi:hypothetical protein
VGVDVSDKPKKAAPKPMAYDDALLARLCERVYRARLGRKDAERMIAEDGDDGKKLRRRSMAYAPIVKCTLDAMKEEEETP